LLFVYNLWQVNFLYNDL